MRQIVATVIRKLLLIIFAPVTVGLLITASASAEPKGSFELSETMPDIAMVYVKDGADCFGRNGDIGISLEGLIFSCQSDGDGADKIWKRPIEIPTVILRDDGLWGDDADYQLCNSDEVVVGGGGECMEPTTHFLHSSQPSSNGWVTNCFGMPGYPDLPSKTYAICMPK